MGNHFKMIKSVLLDLERDALRYSNTDSSTQDTVPTDLSLGTVFHHRTEKP